jgi:hypothetical protein
MQSAADEPWPHSCDDCCEVGTHAPVLGSQQPDGHVVGVQLGGVLEHCWFEQTAPDAPQLVQKAPARPHSAVCVPGSQRPVERLMHPVHSHRPDTQLCPEAHATHAAPPWPHCAALGGWH